MKTIVKENKNLILEFIISVIITKLGIGLFGIENNSIYVVIAVSIIMLLMDKLVKDKDYLKNKKEIIPLIIYALLISIVFTIQSKITFNGDVGLSYLENTFSSFEMLDIAKILVVFVITVLMTLNLGIWFKNTQFSIIDKEKITTKKQIKYWIISSIFVAIPYLLYLLTYAPGAVLGDSLTSIVQGWGDVPFNNHHPVLYSMFVGIFMRIGRMLNNNNIGTMLYSTAQMLIMSGIIGYFLVWLKKHNVKMKYILLTYLFFVANTIFAAYAIIMWKDPLFCGFIFLMTLFLYDIISQNGEPLKHFYGIFKFVILSVLIAFFRNNGIYIVIGMYIAILIWSRKKLLIFNIVNTITVIAIIIIQGPIYTKLGIISPTEESLAIPMQQIARTITYDGEITPEQEEFLNKILPIEKWKSKYEPCVVDSIKWDPDFNKEFLTENKTEFIKIWAQMLPKNFAEYVKAYLMDTYGFWSIETKNKFGFVDTYIIKNDFGIERKDCIKSLTGKSIGNLFTKPDFLGAGTVLWILVLSGVLLIINKKTKYIFVLLLCLISWVSIMVATPVAFSLRYVFMMVYSLPLIIMMPFMTKNEDKC